MNLGYSTTLTNLGSTGTSKNRNNRDKFEFFSESFPNEEPEEIIPEEIIVDRPRPSLKLIEEHPLKRYPDILEVK